MNECVEKFNGDDGKIYNRFMCNNAFVATGEQYKYD